MNALDVSRWQFGITTVYHFIFVPLTIGLAPLIAVMQTAWVVTGNPAWYRLTKFFGKLFLINFALGVATGIVQEFQFGMNWSEYSRFVGDVFGAPLAMEGLVAFFFESTFIGLWIFGWTKLPRLVHLACIWIVAVAVNASAFFIIVWIVLFVTLSFGAIGFYDDYLKISKSKTTGFAGRWRLLTEIIVAGIAAFAVMRIGTPGFSSSLAVPFFKNLVIPLGAFFILLGVFVVVGAGNAVNLTDGLDGLAIVPVMIAAATFGLIAYLTGNTRFATYLQIHYVQGAGELAIICGAIIGAGLGFLWFNAPPAMIFMGVTGSLALGGA